MRDFLEFIYAIFENFTLLVSRDLVYKIALPIVLAVLVLNILSYLFAKEDKKEDIMKSIQGKIIGLIILVLLPSILTISLSLLEKVTGITPNIDTSIINKVQSPGAGDGYVKPSVSEIDSVTT